MRYAKVYVNRNETSSQTVIVAPWEIPLLEFVHPRQDGVVVEGYVDRPEVEYPTDLDSEMERLHTVYRGAPNSKGETVSVVDEIYGAGRLGLRKLEEEIERAKADEAKAQKASRKAAAKNADVEKDPLAA